MARLPTRVAYDHQVVIFNPETFETRVYTALNVPGDGVRRLHIFCNGVPIANMGCFGENHELILVEAIFAHLDMAPGQLGRVEDEPWGRKAPAILAYAGWQVLQASGVSLRTVRDWAWAWDSRPTPAGVGFTVRINPIPRSEP